MLANRRLPRQLNSVAACGPFSIVAPTHSYRNSLHCLSEVVRKEGFFALYRGLSASYLGGVETAIQFMLYEKLKAMRAPPAQATTSSNFTNWRGAEPPAVELRMRCA